MSTLCRRSARRTAARTAGLPLWAADLRTVRGRCLRRKCGNRWAVVRVSLDFRDPERVDRVATLECAACGRTWRRVTAPPLRTPDGTAQAVRLTLILPSAARRWYSRGRWHREGDDGLVLRDADLADLDEAATAHRARQDARINRRERARAARAEAEAEAITRTSDLLARLAARDAAEREAEAAAAARDAA